MPVEAYYSHAISSFLQDDDQRILGILASKHHHDLEEQQTSAWLQQLPILKEALISRAHGRVFLEFYIPRMGKRADAILVIENIVFVVEFKIGATRHERYAIDQVEDYALDLKNFHEGSHSVPIVPVLVSSKAPSQSCSELMFADDLVASPITANGGKELRDRISEVSSQHVFPEWNLEEWISKGYKPTPTIVEAAQTLYRTHSVAEISRSDAGAKNLTETTASIREVIDQARLMSSKSICFVTGVPGSGKTLAGLNVATQRSEKHHDEHAVFLSGNGPLVDVLREALARDKNQRERIGKKNAQRQVHSFIQNIHHFRDGYAKSSDAPIEKVVVFDEAQRAWTREQASKFMQRKRGLAAFDMSEPEFLISVMDRHPDWCTIVCLVGEGQEINTGEAGIAAWIQALEATFPRWQIYISPKINLMEYGSQEQIEQFLKSPRVHRDDYLHLAVSMRSFRAEALSKFVGYIVDNDHRAARNTYEGIKSAYPIYLTRDLSRAKEWLRQRSRGSERFGLVASSGAYRLRPQGIHVKADIAPETWFLNSKSDVRSSSYLEDVATEFAVQGLELDWVGVCWDGDFYQQGGEWQYQAFKGSNWQSIRNGSRRMYLKNAYRVILTRARQGMIIFVPNGDESDATRPAFFYDGTYEYLRACGIPILS